MVGFREILLRGLMGLGVKRGGEDFDRLAPMETMVERL